MKLSPSVLGMPVLIWAMTIFATSVAAFVHSTPTPKLQ
jgi:hypothetical protein